MQSKPYSGKPAIQFAHVGVHKTATKWLQTRVLPKHPQIQMLPQKQFDPLLRYPNSHWFTETWLSGLYEQLDQLPKDGRLIGISSENISGHLISGEFDELIATRMANAFGPVKILLTLRHPYGYMNSMYSTYVKQGGTLTFKSLVGDVHIPGKDLSHRLDYSALIEMYQGCYGSENVLVLPFELLKVDSQRFLGYIYTFLGVDDYVPQKYARDVNTSLTGPATELLRFLNYLGVNRIRSRRVITRLDQRLLKRIFPKVQIASTAAIRQSPKLAALLSDENYHIWKDELAEFNYTFPSTSADNGNGKST